MARQSNAPKPNFSKQRISTLGKNIPTIKKILYTLIPPREKKQVKVVPQQPPASPKDTKVDNHSYVVVVGGGEKNMILRNKKAQQIFALGNTRVIVSGLKNEVAFIKKHHISTDSTYRHGAWDTLTNIIIDVMPEIQATQKREQITVFYIPTGDAHGERIAQIWRLYIAKSFPKAKLHIIPSGEVDGSQEGFLRFMYGLGKIGIEILSKIAETRL
jgi:hypothetical protein